jgi:hypothetical protein
MLRKKIQELQHYRRMGLTTAADIDKYEGDIVRRVCQIASSFVWKNNITTITADPSEG